MVWNGGDDQNKGGKSPGPWGSGGQNGGQGGGSGGGSGGGPSPWGGGNKGRGPSGGGQLPPEITRLIDSVRSRFGGGDGSGGGRRGGPGRDGAPQLPMMLVGGAVLLVGAAWLWTGVYWVQPDEQGVVMRFGAYQETTQPGFHYHLPYPIETVIRPKVTFVNRTDIGKGEVGFADRPGEHGDASLMLTGDENIVDINLAVFWVIKNARDYLFDIRDPARTVTSAGESAIREIVGRTPIATVLAEGRQKVETDTQTLLQSILDSYGAGITITQVQLQEVDPPPQVIEAFRDVQRARTDQERARNEAEAYHNDIVPRARGDAAQIVQDAEAYRQQIVAKASGDAARFTSVLNAYRQAKDVTAERLYIETLEQVLKNSKKVLVDRAAGPVTQYLQLPAPLVGRGEKQP